MWAKLIWRLCYRGFAVVGYRKYPTHVEIDYVPVKRLWFRVLTRSE